MASTAVIAVLLFWVATGGCTKTNGSTGLPRKPFGVRYEFIDIRAYYFHVYWQVDEFQQPDVVYSVEVCPVKDYTDECGRLNCTSPVRRLQEFDCYIEGVERKYDPRNMTLVAWNIFGEARSNTIAILSSHYLIATPLAPTDLRAHVDEGTTKTATIAVEWKSNVVWTLPFLRGSIFELVYHAKGGKNKTKYISISKAKAVLRNLSMYQEYSIYLRAQLVGPGGVRSNFGPFSGPQVVRTPEGVPDAPEVISHGNQVFQDGTLRNVTLTLKIPSPDRWWGEPKPIQIKYTRLTSENDTKRLQVKTFPVTSVNHTVLEGLNSSEQYMVHPIGCNRRHCSQGTGYRIEALDVSVEPNQSSLKEESAPILGQILTITVPAIIVIALLITGFSLRRFHVRQRSNRHENVDLAHIGQNVRVEDAHYNDVSNGSNSANDYDRIYGAHAPDV